MRETVLALKLYRTLRLFVRSSLFYRLFGNGLLNLFWLVLRPADCFFLILLLLKFRR